MGPPGHHSYELLSLRGTAMATEKCAICKKEIDTEYYLVKKCSKCGSWFCYHHLGQYNWQCLLCMTYTLSNVYGS
jgi:hypothetical protein